MNTEEKILALLEQMNARMENLESGQASLDKRMIRLETVQAAFDGRLEWVDQGIRNLNHRMDDLNRIQAAIDGRMGRVETAMAEAKEDINVINLNLELKIGKRLDALSEGQEAIEKRLDTLDEVKELAEGTRDRVDAIHAAVVQHSATITELKQAK